MKTHYGELKQSNKKKKEKNLTNVCHFLLPYAIFKHSFFFHIGLLLHHEHLTHCVYQQLSLSHKSPLPLFSPQMDN
jgi:hypothetical protein